LSRRRTALPWIVSALIVAGFVPALAWGRGESPAAAPASFVALDGPDRFVSPQTDTDTVTVAPGDTVSFEYQGSNVHNVVFNEPPASCRSTSGQPTGGPSGPVPDYPRPGPWGAECTFAAAGTYTFLCGAHPYMTGKVIVAAPTTTPTPTETGTQIPTETATVTATATATATPGPPAAATPGPAATPVLVPVVRPRLDKPASLKLKTFLARGLKVSGGCVAGGSGKLALTIKRAAAKKLKLKGTTLATGTARCSGAGRMTATLKPTAAARKALKRQRRALASTLTLTVRAEKASVAVTLK
jgi:plastocyanin